MAVIWCVEDDGGIRDIEVYALNSMGFVARGFESADQCWESLSSARPALILLDVMLPGTDGVELLRRLKRTLEYSHIPVIMATARGAEFDKIQSLDLGADDYLVKPFGMMEMVSRVKAVLRRCERGEDDRAIKLGTLELDPVRHSVTSDGAQIVLTYKEFELLRLFMSSPGTVFTRDQLFNEIWGMDYCGETRTVDMHIRTLRQKLGGQGELIETVRGVGYRLRDIRGETRA